LIHYGLTVQNGVVQKFSQEEIRTFIAEETIFRDALPASLDRLAAEAVQKNVAEGCSLFSMGQTCDALHFVAAGSGLLVKMAPDGRERLLHRALPGDMVGSVPFFDGGDYPATFVAETDCTVVSFPRETFMKLLASDQRLALGVIGGLVERLRQMVGLVEQLSFEDTTRRLWDYLMQGSTDHQGRGFPRVLDPLPTREKIAMAIGTVREVVSRRLSHLVQTGHLQIDGRRLVLLKPLE